MARIKNGLHCSDAEAKEVLAYDKRVDKEETTEYDLTAEQQKIAKKYTRTGTRTVYKFNTRERKPNATKAGIIFELAEFVEKSSQFSVQDLNIYNGEREIDFRIGDKAYTLTLTQHNSNWKRK